MKLLVMLVVLLALALAGCTSTHLIADRVERICSMESLDRDLARANLDAITRPHQVRVICDAG